MQNRLTRRVILSLALILASSVAVTRAQWPSAGQLRALVDKTSLHRITEGDPPVTTGLDDALTGIDFLDRYKPSTFAPLRAERQDATGAFHVGPGVYEFTAESYCLHAGTHGPGGGDGYVSAPLQGSKRDAVHRILQNAVAHPEIRQQDIQVLLWAILARTRISDMPRNTQLTAARLLTPGELVALNGGAFGMVTDRAWGETNQSLPPAMRRAFEREAQFRQMLSTCWRLVRRDRAPRRARWRSGARLRVAQDSRGPLVVPPRRLFHPLLPKRLLQDRGPRLCARTDDDRSGQRRSNRLDHRSTRHAI